jgi:hypothetical protein
VTTAAKSRRGTIEVPFVFVLDLISLILKDFEIAGDLALRFGINCSPKIAKQAHEAFNVTTEGGDIEAFSKFVHQFYVKFFDHGETSLDEYPTLQTREQWDNAVVAELEKFKEIEGTLIQCSYCFWLKNQVINSLIK